MKQGGLFNSVSGRPKSFAHVDMVTSIYIQDKEKNQKKLFKEKVHMWTSVRVSISFHSLSRVVKSNCEMTFL
jgi:hypothetical protein